MKLLHFIRLFYSAKAVRNLLKFNILLNEGNPGPQGGTLALPTKDDFYRYLFSDLLGGIVTTKPPLRYFTARRNKKAISVF